MKTETQTIEVEGLPEGWKAKEVRVDPDQYNKYVGDDGFLYWEAKIKMEKIQLRRIVLEETDEVRQVMSGDWYELDGKVLSWMSPSKSADLFKIWKEVKETDEEPHLKLTKKDMLELIEHIKLGGELNHKIAEFIDYEQPEPKLGLSVAEVKTIFGCDFELLVKVDKFIKENS